MEWFGVDGDALWLWAINVIGLLGVLVGVRWLYGPLAGQPAVKLGSTDNSAFGIGLAGMTLGMGIMLSGVASGDFAVTPLEEMAALAAYILAGLCLMALTRIIFDRVSLRTLDVKDEVAGGNLAVAIVDAGNLVATAIMLRALMQWTDGALVPALIGLVTGYAAIQLLLTAVIAYRAKLFRERNDGNSFAIEIGKGNAALALRFAGFQAGMALAATAASGLLRYDPAAAPWLQALDWAVFAAAAMILAGLLTFIAEKVVLRGVDVAQEVDREGNVGVGMVEASIYVSIGVMAVALVG